MTRMIRGSVLLAASVALWSCSSDPTADEAGVPYQIRALPSVVFVKEDSAQLIGFSVVDQLDGQVPAIWTIGAAPPEFTVSMDSSYRPVYDAATGALTLPDSQTEVRLTITGVTAGSSSFTVEAGGKSLVVPVKVVPSSLPATFNDNTPDIGADLVVTMPAGLFLKPTATFSFAGAAAPIVVSRAPDGTSATLWVAPGTSAPLTVNGVYPDFAPALSLILNTTTTVTATNTSTYVGTDDPTTAPTITLPPVGTPFVFYDIPSSVDQFYKIVVTGTTKVKVTTDWQDGTSDIDQLWMNSAFALIAPFTGATAAHPEASTATLAAGTYYFFADQYDGDGGAWYKFTVEVVP
jgi:hypothetical protein